MSGGEATLLAALVGGGSAVFAAGLATLSTYKVTNRGIRAQVAAADTVRKQDRIRAVYQLVQIYISEWADYAAYLPSNFVTIAERAGGSFSEFDKPLKADLSLFASKEVGEKMETFASLVVSLRTHVDLEDQHRKMQASGLPRELQESRAAREQMIGVCNEVVERANEILSMMRKELGSDPL